MELRPSSPAVFCLYCHSGWRSRRIRYPENQDRTPLATMHETARHIDKRRGHICRRIFPSPCPAALLLLVMIQLELVLRSAAQIPKPDSVLDAAHIPFARSLDQGVYFGFYGTRKIPDSRIDSLPIDQPLPAAYSQKIPSRLIGQDLFLRFFLRNSADTPVHLYFFPGLFCEQFSLFESPSVPASGWLRLLPNEPLDNSKDRGFQLIRLAPGETAGFIARLHFARTTVDRLEPKLVAQDFLIYFQAALINSKTPMNLLNYLISGILLMMIFYSIAVFLQNRNTEFIYYSVYAFCMALLFFLESYLFNSTSHFNVFFEGFLDFIIQMTGYSFYVLFFRKFLDTRQNHPFLERVLRVSNWVILGLLLAYALVYYLTDGFSLLNMLENATKLYLLAVSLIFIVYGLRKKETLMNYLVAGQLSLTLLSAISFLLIITPLRISPVENSILNDSLLYYEIGLTLELIFFLSGLSYKNRKDLIERVKEQGRLKLENERKEFEKQVAILEAKQSERNRISADMHDELGSGVTAIRLMSEIVKARMKESTLPEIEKISHSANELLTKMNTIIWTMVSSNDTLESLIAYIRAFAAEFFESTAVNCHFHAPDQIPAHTLSGEKRRNLFLGVKEALNNILKHARATEVFIEIRTEPQLMIRIMDNGVGINMDRLRKFGNGLQNMKKRIESIEGSFHIENEAGTTVVFELAL
jgi:signal transduction histidine kinase